MSSWASRNIPKKRDISRIPEEFRPIIKSRVEQPLVVQSEAFQIVIKNEIILKTTEGKKDQVAAVNPRQFVPRKIEVVQSMMAIELINNNKSYVFVILRHIRTVRDNDLWISSYNSIRKFYTNKIIIIDDNWYQGGWVEWLTSNGQGGLNSEIININYPTFASYKLN